VGRRPQGRDTVRSERRHCLDMENPSAAQPPWNLSHSSKETK
jgi:hypothetical protein